MKHKVLLHRSHANMRMTTHSCTKPNCLKVWEPSLLNRLSSRAAAA